MGAEGINPQIFYQEFLDISQLYVEVKEAIILAENFDKSTEVYISPLNELRNALDHLMRSLQYPDKMGVEFDEAKEHLYRAGYDAYEILAINVSQSIVKIIENYNTEIITAVFPIYYTDIKPRLIELQVELGDERAHKRLNPDTGTKSFLPYKEKISGLIQSLKICEKNIPTLQNEKIKQRKNGIIKTLTGALIGLAIGVAGMIIYDEVKTTDNLTKSNTNKPAESKQDAQKNPPIKNNRISK